MAGTNIVKDVNIIDPYNVSEALVEFIVPDSHEHRHLF